MKLLMKYKIKKLVKNGLKIGINVKVEKGVMIDSGFPYLITIGNNVTMAPHVQILSHDASTKPFLNYTKLGRVNIGNNVFIGAKSIILPNVNIGNNVVIGAGSIVTKDIQDNVVVAGVPAKVICSLEEYLEKNKKNMSSEYMFNKEYTIKNITEEKKNEVIEKVNKHRTCYIL